MKSFNIVVLMLVGLLAAVSVSAVPVSIDTLKIDGDVISPTSTNEIRVLDRDNELVVKVIVSAEADVDDAQIEAVLRGYDDDDLIEDITSVFDMRANRTYVKTLNLRLPDDLDKDQYKLRVRVEDRDGDTTQETYEIDIENERHDMQIKDVVFSPGTQVMAGRALLTTVRVKNVGMVDQDDGVKIYIKIPELGVAASDYIDEVDEDDSVTSEELYVRIPSCTPEGDYKAVIGVEYKDGDRNKEVSRTISVVKGSSCEAQEEEEEPVARPKTVITVGPTEQDVEIGNSGVIYPLTITNAGNSAKSYVISSDGTRDWADIRISPANVVVLQPGEAKALYVYVSAKEDAAPGEKMFSLSVKSGGETLKDFTLKANVVGEQKDSAAGSSSNMDVKNILLVGLLVLVVLLVILGLIIGFGKLRGDDRDEFDDDDESGQTYY